MSAGTFTSLSGAGAMATPPLATVLSIDASPAAADIPEPDESAVRPAAPAAAPEPVRVAEQTTAWAFAEEHLGDGMRWQELWTLNHDQPQPDGQRWRDPEDDLAAGWLMRVPADVALAVAPSETPPSPPAPPTSPAAIDLEVEVASGDHFWSLAEARLTDTWGRPVTDDEVRAYWQVLVDANRDRLAAPHDPNLIYPGQTLTTPDPGPDPTNSALAPPAAPTPTEVPVAEAPPAPAPAPVPSPDEPAPDQEVAPETTASEREEPSDASGPVTPERPAPTTGDAPSTEDGSTQRPAGESPAPTGAPRPPESAAGGTPPEPSPSSTSTTTSTERAVDVPTQDPTPVASTAAEGESESTAPVGPVLGVAGTALAVAVLRALRRRRRRRAAQLPVGVVPPAPPRSSRPVAEEVLAADEDQADRLDAALANLCSGLNPRGGETCAQPQVVQVTGHRVEVMLDRPDPSPPPPWRPEASGRVWVLDDATELQVPDAMSPLPALVTIGADEADLLIDIEAFGVVTITGDPENCWAMARSMVTEMAAKAEGTIGIELVGALEDHLAGLDGVRRVGSWDDVDTGVIAGSARMLDAGRWPHTFAARASGRVFDGWVPAVWVTTPSDSPHYLDAVEQVGTRPGAGSAIVIAAGETDTAIGHGIRIIVAADGTFRVPELGLSGQAQLLEVEAATQVLDLLDDAAHTAVAQTFEFPVPGDDVDAETGEEIIVQWPDDTWATHGHQEVLDWPDGGINGNTDSAAADTDNTGVPVSSRLSPAVDRYEDPPWSVLVRVCGEIAVEGGKSVLTGPEAAVATFVALHRQADIDQIRDAIWGGRDVTRKRVRNVVANVRRALGEHLYYPIESRLAVGERCLTDLEVIRRRLAYAHHQSDLTARADTLRGGLEWVTGRVCSYPSTARRAWTWIDLDNWIPTIESTVGAVAHDLAALYLDLGDAAGVTWAAARGIDATGPREQLTVLLVRGYALAGDAPAAAAALRAYERHMDDLGGTEHSEELLELLDRYLPARPGRAAS